MPPRIRPGYAAVSAEPLGVRHESDPGCRLPRRRRAFRRAVTRRCPGAQRQGHQYGGVFAQPRELTTACTLVAIFGGTPEALAVGKGVTQDD